MEMFRWQPPPLPPRRTSHRNIDMAAAPPSAVPSKPSYDLENPYPQTTVVFTTAPQPPTVTVTDPQPTWNAGDVQRRQSLAASWGRSAGLGITGVQTFGDGAQALVAFGDACSAEWVKINVQPIWRALQAHGFLAMHCQGPLKRWSWPRRDTETKSQPSSQSPTHPNAIND